MIKDRKALLAIVTVVAIIAIYHDPQGSGGIMRTMLDIFANTITGLFDFAGTVTR